MPRGRSRFAGEPIAMTLPPPVAPPARQPQPTPTYERVVYLPCPVHGEDIDACTFRHHFGDQPATYVLNYYETEWAPHCGRVCDGRSVRIARATRRVIECAQSCRYGDF